MSSIDPNVRPTVRPDAPSSLSSSSRANDAERRSRADSNSNEARDALSLRKRDTASEVLARVAERALEHPPRDLQKLAASATKFLLINLEPALQLAQQLRPEVLGKSRPSVAELLRQDRGSTVLELLSDE